MTDIPRLLIGTTRAAYIGPSFDLSPHANAACTVAVALEQLIRFRTWHRKTGWANWQQASVVLIPGETLHHLQCKGRMLFLYLDPQADDEKKLTQHQLMKFRSTLLTRPEQEWDLAQLCELLGLPDRRDPISSRLRHALELLDHSPAQFKTIEDAAEVACLSSSRFRALFNQYTGLTFRRYRLWRKMAVAVRAVQQGKSLTDAAQDAGFSDSAHFSTAFKAMFGISPSLLLTRSIEIQCEAETKSFVAEIPVISREKVFLQSHNG
ncbi:MAG TPA: AraC family transcriptional regulator [Limnobacter sp.]|nr:AraC family transcriptional regulator [Limnobacter sp.]